MGGLGVEPLALSSWLSMVICERLAALLRVQAREVGGRHSACRRRRALSPTHGATGRGACLSRRPVRRWRLVRRRWCGAGSRRAAQAGRRCSLRRAGPAAVLWVTSKVADRATTRRTLRCAAADPCSCGPVAHRQGLAAQLLESTSRGSRRGSAPASPSYLPVRSRRPTISSLV